MESKTMGKKTGRKAAYLQYGGHELKEMINGHEIGLSLDASTLTHYTMIPQKMGRTKRLWLGRDKDNAIIKFRALVTQLRGTEEKYTQVDIDEENQIVMKVKVNGLPESFSLDDLVKADALHFTKTGTAVRIKETDHIEWLKRELQNPSQLAQKTGLEFFNHVEKHILKKPIALSTLYENYTHSNRYAKTIDLAEKQRTKATWDLFLSIMGKTTLEQIGLEDVKAFEKYLHSQGYSDVTIFNYRNRVMKIIRYNIHEYDDTTRLLKVIEYFSKWEDLEVGGSSTISAQAINPNDFNTLYERADTELKAVLLLCLNTATYLREVSRFRISDIDFNVQTLMTRRNKTGRCRKFAYLWDRTIQALNAYINTRHDHSDILFIAHHGGPYANGVGLRRRFDNLRKVTGLLHIKFCHLRDTFETIGKETGLSQYHIDLVMGHRSGKMGDRYTHRRIHNELKNACLAVEKDFFTISTDSK
jgi:integrase